MKIIDFSKQIFRCHSFGNLMASAKKEGELSAGAKTHLECLFKEIVFGKKEYISSKETQKGLACENGAITLYSKIINEFIFKNNERVENSFFSGEYDCRTDDTVIDIKCPWSLKTFPLFEKELKNKIYYTQIQAYMYLLGLNKGQVVYCLMDTPDTLIQDAKRNYGWRNEITDLPEHIEKDIENNMTFSDIPEKLRCKVFEIGRDDEYIEKMKNKAILSRDYLNSLYDTLTL
jgi:hypothetical protein